MTSIASKGETRLLFRPQKGALGSAVGFTASIVNRRLSARWVVFVMLFGFASFFPRQARSQPKSSVKCRVVVVGYTGGLDTPGNPYSGIVEIRDRLRALNHPDLCVRTFSAYTWWHGYHWVRSKFGIAGSQVLSSEELAAGPKVIVYGHSFGGWATHSLSRRLQGNGIPVVLTVQIDTVGIKDTAVPTNVGEAANYHRKAFFPPYGQSEIYATDPGKTRILGNFYIAHVNHLGVARAQEVSDMVVNKVEALYEMPE